MQREVTTTEESALPNSTNTLRKNFSRLKTSGGNLPRKKAKKHKDDQLKKANAKLEADKKKAEPKAPLHREQRLREIFKLCDGDKNGYLTVKEYRKLMAKSSSQNIDIAVAVFTMIDEAGKKDGKLGPEEFVTYNLKGGAGMSDELFKQQTDLWLELAKAKGP